MKYFAAFLKMEKPELNQQYRQAHLDFLAELDEKGFIFARGAFTDGTGGLVIYQTEDEVEARALAEQDPYLVNGVRSLELHEWNKM
ncbi:YciI family protein [Terribacillus saccharophilus]|uniref:YciI family protein n=1 Tax=Terribacillus saccharophilus TaxID=361277 RepID=UPI002DC9C3C6|nr:YciI family protein [Terribacillus saccharophilus]